MQKRILFISRKWPPAIGGMETYAVELVAGLKEVSDVDVLVLPGNSDGRTPGLAAYALFLFKAMLVCALRARSYDQVVFGDLILFPAGVCHWIFNRNAKRLVIVYGLDLVYHRRSGILPAVYRALFSVFRASQSCFDSIVAISSYTAKIAQQNGLRNVVIINPSLPDTGSYPDTPENRPPESWSAAEGRTRILYFGRLVPRKGSYWFASLVMPLLSDATVLFVVGDSSDAEYKAGLKQCARTHVLGRVYSPNLSAMIRSADAVVMPNIPTPDNVDVEGFGLAAIETSSLGGRLLASRLDGITDAVLDGITGTLVEPGSPEAWASALNELFEAELKGILPCRESVASKTREHFSRTVQATSFLRLLRRT